MKNKELREYAKKHNVYLWEIAMKLGISEPTITRQLRTELPKETSSKLMYVIDQISKEKEREV